MFKYASRLTIVKVGVFTASAGCKPHINVMAVESIMLQISCNTLCVTLLDRLHYIHSLCKGLHESLGKSFAVAIHICINQWFRTKFKHFGVTSHTFITERPSFSDEVFEVTLKRLNSQCSKPLASAYAATFHYFLQDFKQHIFSFK